METYEIDTIKVEKQKAMRRYQTFRKLANIARSLEVFLAIALISISLTWTSSFIPTALEFSCAFLQRVSSLFFSPHFVFLVGNAIVITLFANSSSSPSSTETFVDVEVNFDVTVAHYIPSAEQVIVAEKVVKPAEEEEKEKVYRRSKSVSQPRMEMAVVKELRRSKTQPRRIRKEAEEEAKAKARKDFEEEELSNEEFRRKVEAFIEKQQKALREERMAVVVSNQRSISM